MNFSKKGTIKKQQQIRSISKKLTMKAGISFFRTFLVCIAMVIIVSAFAGFGLLKGIIDNSPSIDSINVMPEGYASTLYDAKGNEIKKLVGSDANRIYVEIENIPLIVQNAFIAIEDERFRSHNGIDVRGIFRAFFTGLAKKDFDQGASTITQQLLKNQVFEGGMETSFSEKFERKIQEQYLALQLEKKLNSKDLILEYYLNTINLGQNTLGVQAASHRYFNKDVSELTLSEAAVIAGITKSPSNLNPITDPVKNAERRTAILDNMKTQGYISEAAYTEALNDNVYERIQLVNEEQTASSTSINSYFVDETIEQVVNDLQIKLGYTSTQAYNLLYRGGLKVYTTQNPKLQKICDKIVADESLYPANSTFELTYRLTKVDKDGTKTNYNELMLREYFKAKNPDFNLYFKKKEDATSYIEEYRSHVLTEEDTIEGEVISFTIQPQISFVLMNQKTGVVEAIVGGRGEKTANRTLNRATSTTRSPGSTFKIVSTYLPGLDTKGMTLASVKDDAEYYYPNSDKKVNNWDQNRYYGLTTMRQAIYNSMNVVAVKTLEEVTPATAFTYLQKLGFTTIVENRTDESTGKVYSDINLSMALGGLTDGVTNLELTSSFAAIANNGLYNKPIFYTKIVDHNGKVLIDNTTDTTQVMKDSTAWLLTNAMEDVVTVGTGKKLAFQSIDMPISGKTGTTTGALDLWFVGYTPYYTAGIWGGYDNNEIQSDTSYHKVIWRTIMEEIHKNLEKKEFTKPDSIITANICTKCGRLAIEGVCNQTLGGSKAKKEYFAKGTKPTETCNCHVKVQVCSSSGRTPTKFCPQSLITEKVYLTKEETSQTEDTNYILPKNFEKYFCNVHGKQVPQETPEPEETIDPNGEELPSDEPTTDEPIDNTDEPDNGTEEPPSTDNIDEPIPSEEPPIDTEPEEPTIPDDIPEDIPDELSSEEEEME